MKGGALGRPRGRKKVEVRRRRRRLAPGVIGICFVMVLAAFVFVVMPSPALGAHAGSAGPACIRCPDGVHCYPNCGPPPPTPCPTPYALYIGSGMLATNPTNVSVQYWLLSTSGETSASSSLAWGPTTSYQYTAISNQGVGTSGAVTAFIDYLDPSTTYYYHAHAWTSCTDSSGTHQYTGDYYGLFTTGSEATYVSHYGAVIRGVVYNANGNTAPAGLQVEVQCAGGGPFWQNTFTNAHGVYSITPAYGASGCQSVGYGYYLVEVKNIVAAGIQWPGYWNESVVIWAVQFVNFYLPLNYVSPYFSEVLDFSNAPAGGYSDLKFQTGTSSTLSTDLSYTWSLGGGSGPGFSGSSSSTTSYTVGAQGGVESTVGNLDYIIQQETSGTVEFNAIDRAWQQTSVVLSGPFLNGEFAQQNSNYVEPATWLKPGTNAPDTYYLTSLGKPMQNVYDNVQGKFYVGEVTTSTTIASSGGYSVAFALGVSLPGVGSVGLNVGSGWSQTSSTTYSNTLDWTAGEPYGGSPICIDVFGQGGSGTYADMVGIYTWAPSQGACTGG